MRKRRRSGQSLIEVTVGIICVVPVVLCLIDLSVILLGVQANDANCRNAARAAATGNPTEATSRAQTVMSRCNLHGNNLLVSGSTLCAPVSVKVVSRPASEPDVALGTEISNGGPVLGSATVLTQVEVRPFIVHMIYGGKSPLKFTSKQSFPISYIEPAQKDELQQAQADQEANSAAGQE